MTNDWQRITWLEEALKEGVKLRLEKEPGALTTVWVGQVEVQGYNLREAIDVAMGAQLMPINPHV